MQKVGFVGVGFVGVGFVGVGFVGVGFVGFGLHIGLFIFWIFFDIFGGDDIHSFSSGISIGGGLFIW